MTTWILINGLTVDEALWNSNIDYIIANLDTVLPDPTKDEIIELTEEDFI